jgi:hypothetical protein
MSLTGIPRSWLSTLDVNKDVILWRSDPNFPYPDMARGNVTEMLSYIQGHWPTTFSIMMSPEDVDTDIPQSFPHWWCNMRFSENVEQKSPEYPTLRSWKAQIRGRHVGPDKLVTSVECTGMTVITVFLTWLGQLYTDMVLFTKSEKTRKNVPRLYGRSIIYNNGDSVVSRSETLRFLKAEGLKIFKERGFQEGATYWLNLCKKYTF